MENQNNEPDHHILHERRLGPGYRFAIRSVVFIIFGTFMLFAGATWVKLEQSESNSEVLKLDSIAETEIRKRDEELRAEGKALILKLGRIYDDDGNPHPEWVQFLKRQRAIARARSNDSTIGERATDMFDKIKRVWE